VCNARGYASRSRDHQSDQEFSLPQNLAMMVSTGLALRGALRSVVELHDVYSGAAPRPRNRPAGAPLPDSSAPVGRATTRPLVLTMFEQDGLR
jgi:hypothetical protein